MATYVHFFNFVGRHFRDVLNAFKIQKRIKDLRFKFIVISRSVCSVFCECLVFAFDPLILSHILHLKIHELLDIIN